jgi:small subunit ribosomal protein S18
MNSGRPSKTRTRPGILGQEHIEYVDYKDVALLERCVSDRSKIRARRSSGNGIQQQREIERAVKNAREMALLPYAQRVESKARAPRGERTRSGAVTTDQIEETE